MAPMPTAAAGVALIHKERIVYLNIRAMPLKSQHRSRRIVFSHKRIAVVEKVGCPHLGVSDLVKAPQRVIEQLGEHCQHIIVR